MTKKEKYDLIEGLMVVDRDLKSGYINAARLESIAYQINFYNGNLSFEDLTKIDQVNSDKDELKIPINIELIRMSYRNMKELSREAHEILDEMITDEEWEEYLI